ncbi:fumarylacetoacetase [Lipingzhangella sp. LS1_29]|uniref:fumarylacetoacetase n=1 Tax=Lipingzhangella rawalii TaxID=2055835 RepID=A0ABU2H6P1_9ACTN|nr:fumarylacetoacetase [Lipingzhangella rawalii]MDS1270974.1 fumarylacetoacetase [Lipingzhangella rawalii]
MATCWVPGAEGSGFGLDNLPYGVFSRATTEPRVGVRIGEYVLDLAAALREPEFAQSSLNAFLAAGSTAWRSTRAKVGGMLGSEAGRRHAEEYLVPLTEARLHLPFEVADFVDFYCSEDHASNVGRMFRPDQEPLKPNWRHLPVGYHGRSGTVVLSGGDIVRPHGQRKAPDAELPSFGPSERLDFEAELGFVVGTPSRFGSSVTTADFAEHVFGVVLVNDWSARDIQAWEYVPLGPFLGKSFATSISPWVVPLDALAAARVPGPVQEPEPLPYLQRVADWGLDLRMEVRVNDTVLSRPPYSRMYWTGDQMLAHLTSNGSPLRTGDLFASGTVSGMDRAERGSLLELSWAGTDPVTLADGSERTFLADGDTVTIGASAPGAGGSQVSLGAVTGTVRPVA